MGKIFIESEVFNNEAKMGVLVWFMIISLVLFLVLAVRYSEVRHKFGLILTVLFLIFIVGSVAQVYASNNINLTTYEGFSEMGQAYLSWLGSFFGNLGNIAGYAFHQDWRGNSTAEQ